jgi:hypothetical protein
MTWLTWRQFRAQAAMMAGRRALGVPRRGQAARLSATAHLSARQPFLAFQWLETGIYLALALGLAGLCFWRLRHRLS